MANPSCHEWTGKHQMFLVLFSLRVDVLKCASLADISSLLYYLTNLKFHTMK